MTEESPPSYEASTTNVVTTEQIYPPPAITNEPAATTMNRPSVTYQQQSVNFGENPVRTVCPRCNKEVLTETINEVNNVTLCITCVTCCWCLVCIPSLQNIAHQCPNCSTRLGLFERNSSAKDNNTTGQIGHPSQTKYVKHTGDRSRFGQPKSQVDDRSNAPFKEHNIGQSPQYTPQTTTTPVNQNQGQTLHIESTSQQKYTEDRSRFGPPKS